MFFVVEIGANDIFFSLTSESSDLSLFSLTLRTKKIKKK